MRFLSIKEGNFHVLVGDGVKQSKEKRHMPDVKKFFQESPNSAKPEKSTICLADLGFWPEIQKTGSVSP